MEMNYVSQTSQISKIISYDGIPDSWTEFYKASLDIDSFSITIRDNNNNFLIDSFFKIGDIGDSVNYSISFAFQLPTEKDVEAQLKHNNLANNPNRDFLQDSTKSWSYMKPTIFCLETILDKTTSTLSTSPPASASL